jgi:hypothetical protein
MGEKSNVQTRNLTNDAFAVALWKIRKLSKPYPRENIQERNSPSRVFGAEQFIASAPYLRAKGVRRGVVRTGK